MKNWRMFLFLILSMINISFAWGGGDVDLSQVKASLNLDKAKVKMGDSVVLSINVNAPQDYGVDIEEIGQKIQGLRIVDAGTDQPKKNDDEVVYRKWYKLETDLSGSYVLPEAKITLSNQGVQKEINTSEIFLEVEGTGNKEKSDQPKEELRDIKNLEKVDHGLSPLVKILLFLLLLGGGGALFYFFYYKKRGVKEVIQVILPYQKALDRLDKLTKVEISSSDSLKKYHFELSQLFRDYVEEAFGFKASDMTYDEIKKNIDSFSTVSNDLIKDFLTVMEKTDVVKFTDILLTPEESEKLRQKTQNFVQTTMPHEDSQNSDEGEVSI